MGDLGFDAVLFDAGGVLVLPDPTVLAPLLAPYGGSTDLDRHRRAHYAAMAVKSHLNHGEHDWAAYDETYVRAVGVDDDVVDARRPGPRSVPDPGAVALADPRVVARSAPVARPRHPPRGRVQRQRADRRHAVPGRHLPGRRRRRASTVRCVIDSHVVGVAKPDPAIFEHAAHEFGGIDRSRIVYVGDSVTIDVAAATAAGLRPVLLDPYDDHVGAPFERIRDVGDLLG